jgi:hypothetical protein
MCPFCLATMGLIVGAVSTGGLATLVVKASRKNSGVGRIQLNSDEKESQHVDEHANHDFRIEHATRANKD